MFTLLVVHELRWSHRILESITTSITTRHLTRIESIWLFFAWYLLIFCFNKYCHNVIFGVVYPKVILFEVVKATLVQVRHCLLLFRFTSGFYTCEHQSDVHQKGCSVKKISNLVWPSGSIIRNASDLKLIPKRPTNVVLYIWATMM